jgi:hypothetical protein
MARKRTCHQIDRPAPNDVAKRIEPITIDDDNLVGRIGFRAAHSV